MWDVERTNELGDMVVARLWYCKAFYHGNQRSSQQRSRTIWWTKSVSHMDFNYSEPISTLNWEFEVSVSIYQGLKRLRVYEDRSYE